MPGQSRRRSDCSLSVRTSVTEQPYLFHAVDKSIKQDLALCIHWEQTFEREARVMQHQLPRQDILLSFPIVLTRLTMPERPRCCSASCSRRCIARKRRLGSRKQIEQQPERIVPFQGNVLERKPCFRNGNGWVDEGMCEERMKTR